MPVTDSSNITTQLSHTIIDSDKIWAYTRELMSPPTDTIIVIIDKQFKLAAYNSNFNKYWIGLTGNTPVLGEKLHMLGDDENTILIENFELVLKEGKSHTQSGEYTVGSAKFVFTDFYKAVTDNNVVIGAVAFLTDNTVNIRNQRTWDVLLNLSQQFALAENLTELLHSLRENLSDILNTENFIVALYDEYSDTYRLPYAADQKQKYCTNKPYSLKNSITDYVRSTGIPLLLSKKKELEKLIKSGNITPIGHQSASWLGVPLKNDGKTIGVLIVQSYTLENLYTNEDLMLLSLISERVTSAVERKKSQEQITESNRQLRVTESVAKVGTWEYVFLSRTVRASAEAMRIMGFEPNRPYINRVDIFDKIHKPHIRLMRIALLKSISEHKAFDIEVKINHIQDGNLTTVHFRGDVIYGKNNAPLKFVGIVQDITKQKNIEISLKKAKEKAEVADKLKSAFLANMSHEIRTPMNAILGFSRLLSEEGIPLEQRKEYTEYIHASGNSLLNLIDDIIDVAKIEAGQLKISKEATLLNPIFRNAKKSFDSQMIIKGKEHIDLRMELGQSNNHFSIYSDPHRLQQILNNLIGNAVKFTQTGYIEFGYRIEQKNVLLFFVKDTGIGIPNDRIDVIFERFGRIEGNKIKDPGGTGLGLSITKHLTKALGGKIWVESSPKGTTFFFTLPFVKTKYKDKKRGQIGDLGQKANFKSILIVEDNPVNQQLIHDTLKRFANDLHIDIAENGKEALNVFSENNYDAIVMDVRMPVMNGYDATRYIREKFSKPKNQIPILGLSAHAMKEEKERCIQSGMDDYLTKPFIPEELIMKLNHLVGGVRQIPVALKIEEKETPEPKTKSNNFEHINLQVLDTTYKGDSQKIVKILKLCQATIPKQMLELKKAFENSNWKLVQISAHTLKTTFTYLGMQEVRQKMSKIESEATVEKMSDLINKNINFVEAIWPSIKNEIDSFIISVEKI